MLQRTLKQEHQILDCLDESVEEQHESTEIEQHSSERRQHSAVEKQQNDKDVDIDSTEGVAVRPTIQLKHGSTADSLTLTMTRQLHLRHFNLILQA